jgi:K+-transporting ATPase ATPase A chain
MTGAVQRDARFPDASQVAFLLCLICLSRWSGAVRELGQLTLFIYLILTVFLTGLMVGRTPEFLGRKVEKQEIVLASVILLVHPIAVLIPSAITLAFLTL